MIKVIGVRFRKAGKVYYFDPAQMEIKMGDHVIVETARGIEYGSSERWFLASARWMRRR